MLRYFERHAAPSTRAQQSSSFHAETSATDGRTQGWKIKEDGIIKVFRAWASLQLIMLKLT